MAYPSETSKSQREGERLGERMGEASSSAVRSAGETAKSLQRDMSSAVDNASEMAQEKLDALTTYVRRNPLQSTAIAAGIGFVFALIARR